MKAGLAKVKITPPLGTPMEGFGGRDREQGCVGVHDDLFVRALSLEHDGCRALIMAADVCFFERAAVDRCKGAIGRALDLTPAQILINTSHTHVGPRLTHWAYVEPDPVYVDWLGSAFVRAACMARDAEREATAWAGATRTRLPVSRRKRDAAGAIQWWPAPAETVCDHLPICLFKDLRGRAIALLFSVSCHPSTTGGFEISADYPGEATARMDEHLGAPASVFLQGTGGDAKARVIASEQEGWRRGTWEDVAEAGRIVAQEVIRAIEQGLDPVDPGITTCLVDTRWPLEPPPDRAQLEAALADPKERQVRREWAKAQLAVLDRGCALPEFAPVRVHGVRVGSGVRLVGLEGEAVAALGLLINGICGDGVTFPLGYTNGAQLYLPTTEMLREGGYEVESYYEYGYPSRLAPGMESILKRSIEVFRSRGAL